MTAERQLPLIFAPLIVLLGVGWLHAENLNDAWQLALSANPQLQAQRINTNAAGLNLSAAERGRLPKGSLNAVDAQLMSRTPNVNTGNLGQAGGQAAITSFPFVFGTNQNNIPLAFTSLSQPVYAGGRIRGNVNVAGAQASRQRAEQSRTALDLKLNVAEGYVGVLQGKRNLQVATSDVDRLRSFLEDVKNRQRVGMATRNEELSAEVSLANARLREIQTRNALTNAWGTYNRYLMRPLDFITELQEVAPPEPPVVVRAQRGPASVEEQPPENITGMEQEELARLTNQALRSRPELASLSQQARAQLAQADVTRAGIRPNVNVAVNYVYLGLNGLTNNNIVAATATGSWNFYDGGTTRRQAEAQEQQSRALLRQRADEAAAIALEVRTRWINLAEAQERIVVSRVAVRQSEENVNVVQDRYRQQLSTYTEVLDAEAQRVQAYANFYNATYDAALAWFRLRRAVGDL